MSTPVRIELLPLGQSLTVEPGSTLQDALFAQGVEFPCGGRGRCKGCRIKVLSGTAAPTEEDTHLLTAAEIAEGWRLSCRLRAETDLKLELAQWQAAILADNSVFAFTPRPGLGLAIDVGTTTVVAQLLDLTTGHVLGVRTALNAQAQQGADIMSRVEFGAHSGGQRILTQLIRDQVAGLIGDLLPTTQPRAPELKQIVLVGNTVMHHLFCGLDVAPLSHSPFEPTQDGLQVQSADQLGWALPGNPEVRFLTCLGGFVGSDILAGVLATRLHETEALTALLDLGTNGEIVLGNRERMLCASTAAGPAFEGARISMGMRAATGAISEVSLLDGQLRCQVLGHGTPRGICGSGLVDAVACGLELGVIHPSGRFKQSLRWPLAAPVHLTQADVRELQLAKAAIAAGLRILAREWGAALDQITRVYLAGAFGNYINRLSARRIGLLQMPPDRVEPAGNTALLGAKLALFRLPEADGSYPDLRARIRHVSLHEDRQFQQTYIEEMRFPEWGP